MLNSVIASLEHSRDEARGFANFYRGELNRTSPIVSREHCITQYHYWHGSACSFACALIEVRKLPGVSLVKAIQPSYVAG